MQKLVFISCILLFTGLAFTQQYKPYNTFNKSAELQKFTEQGGKVKEISPNVYKLTYRTGQSRTFNLNHKANIIENNKGVDTTIINMWEIDTTKYSSMFTFWQKVEVANFSLAPLPVEDMNKNGRPELFGPTDVLHPNVAGPVKIFERNLNGIFQDIFSYDESTVYVVGIGDIKGKGSKEILLDSTDNGGADVDFYSMYRSDSSLALPTTYDFSFYLDTLQINNIVFGDFDKNGITDCALVTNDGWDTTRCAISEYRDSINNFKEVFKFSSIYEGVLSGFAIGDFDCDGKTELAISSAAGNVIVIKNEDVNQYAIVNHFPFPTYNAYMQTATNDIDGNGKPEFWIGGQDFEQGITVYQAYEYNGDKSYYVVARIELRYSTSFITNYIQSVDIDGDGKEELVISSGNAILILKFVGSPGNFKFKPIYVKMDELTQPGVDFDPVAIADLNGDGKKDLLIPMEKYTSSVTYLFSYILKRSEPTNVMGNLSNTIDDVKLSAYPSPFNSESTINFHIIETSNVQLKIFNILGKEIKTLLNKKLSPGVYNITWDAKDNNGNSLPSGIYFIVLNTKNTTKVFKIILLK